MLNDPGSHPIIEQHLPVHEPVLEVDVHDLGRQLVGDLGQGQVVGRDEADRARSIRPRTTDSAPTQRSCELVPWKSSSNKKRSGSGPRAGRPAAARG